MSNDNYYNHYVSILTNTMTDAVVRNVSLQTTIKVQEETINDLNKTIELMDAEIGNIQQSENSKIKALENELNILRDQLNEFNNMRSEYEQTKNQVKHIETFKSELIKCRDENKQLSKKVDYLQLPPAKRKKLDLAKEKEEKPSEIDGVKDGGTF